MTSRDDIACNKTRTSVRKWVTHKKKFISSRTHLTFFFSLYFASVLRCLPAYEQQPRQSIKNLSRSRERNFFGCATTTPSKKVYSKPHPPFYSQHNTLRGLEILFYFFPKISCYSVDALTHTHMLDACTRWNDDERERMRMREWEWAVRRCQTVYALFTTQLTRVCVYARQLQWIKKYEISSTKQQHKKSII
jgi:hypothetical protein